MLSVQKNELSAGKIHIHVKVSTCAQGGTFDEKGCY